jgi:hypothetical protein
MKLRYLATCLILIVGLVAYLAVSYSKIRNCNQLKVESVVHYVELLHDRNFVWNGPTSNEYQIPTLGAARALAFVGDEAAESLINSFEDKTIDFKSIYFALYEIGLPMEEFENKVMHGDLHAIREWWRTHRTDSKQWRSQLRLQIGLPSL